MNNLQILNRKLERWLMSDVSLDQQFISLLNKVVAEAQVMKNTSINVINNVSTFSYAEACKSLK